MVKKKKKTRNPRWPRRKTVTQQHRERESTVVHRKKPSKAGGRERVLTVLGFIATIDDPRLNHLNVAVAFTTALNKAGLPYEQMAALAQGPNILLKRVADFARNPGTLLYDTSLARATVLLLVTGEIFFVDELEACTASKLIAIDGFMPRHLKEVRRFLKDRDSSLAGEK